MIATLWVRLWTAWHRARHYLILRRWPEHHAGWNRYNH
jgi:hypothetical protein